MNLLNKCVFKHTELFSQKRLTNAFCEIYQDDGTDYWIIIYTTMAMTNGVQ